VLDVRDDAAIAVSGLHRRFGRVTALDGISFSVGRGEVVGLLGHNGAGKTTTIRVLNGLFAPHEGEVRVLGLDPATDGARIRARSGVLTETPSLDERLTARENLAFFARLYALEPARARTRVAELLERFELTDRARDKVSGFSRGMKQRLALARALLHDPELLFLDEPTAALDPVAARDVHDLIRGFAGEDDRTVMISTHNLVEAQRLCDRVLILRQGQLVAEGTPQELARRLGRSARVEFELDPDQRQRAIDLLATTGHVGQAAGDDVVAADGVSREDLPRLVALLAAQGVALYRVSPAEPTLEDVYFALYGAHEPQPAVDSQDAAEAQP